MRKILGLTVAALLVMGLVGGGTWAYFSDTETLSSNTIAAGTLTLSVESDAAAAFSVSDAYPSQKAQAENWTLENTGSINGLLTVSTSNITATDAQADGAHLHDDVYVLFWLDMDGDDEIEDGDILLNASGTTTWSSGGSNDPLSYDESDYYIAIESMDDNSWADVMTLNQSGGVEATFRANFYFLDTGSEQNDAQGDELELDITFAMEQTS